MALSNNKAQRKREKHHKMTETDVINQREVKQMAKTARPSNRKTSFFLYKLAKPLTALIAFPFFSFRIIGEKPSLPADGAAILAGNHIHAADPVLVSYPIKRTVRFMGKSELFSKPFLRWVCTSFGAFPVVRGSAAAADAMRTSLNILQDGGILGIFPEGTRSRTGAIGEGKAGVSILAYRSQAPIYPFAVYAKRKPLSLFCQYTIAFGEPVTAADLGIINGTSHEYRDGAARLMQIISDLHAKCREARA